MTDEAKKPGEGNEGAGPSAKPDGDVESRVRGLAKELEKARAELSATKAAQEAAEKKRAEDEAKARGEWEKVAQLAKQEAEKEKARADALAAEYARKERVMSAKASGLDEFTALGLEVAWREKPEAERGEFAAFLTSSLETLKASAPRAPAPMVGAPANGNRVTNDEALLKRPLGDPEGDAARARMFNKLTGAAN